MFPRSYSISEQTSYYKNPTTHLLKGVYCATEILITKENYFSFLFIVSFLRIFVIVFCVLIQFYFLGNFGLFIELFLSTFKLFVSKFLRFCIVSILVHVFLDLIYYSWSKSQLCITV